MKQFRINAAYRVLNNLATQQLPIKASYRVLAMLKMIQPAIDVQIDLEKRLMSKHKELFTDKGVMRDDLKTDAEKDMLDAYAAELSEALNEESAVEVTPAKIPLDEFGNATLSPADLSALEGFIEFE